jgi:hypothetical protein
LDSDFSQWRSFTGKRINGERDTRKNTPTTTTRFGFSENHSHQPHPPSPSPKGFG